MTLKLSPTEVAAYVPNSDHRTSRQERYQLPLDVTSENVDVRSTDALTRTSSDITTMPYLAIIY
jgi:hypothetical protein